MEQDVKNQFANLKPQESILDYYNKSYNEYDPNAYRSAEYQQQMRNIMASQATALNAAQNRRGALAAIPGLVRTTDVASQGAVSAAEAAKGAKLSRLGQASGMLASEKNRIRYGQLGLLQQEAAAKAAQSREEAQNAANLAMQGATMGMQQSMANDTNQLYKQYLSKIG